MKQNPINAQLGPLCRRLLPALFSLTVGVALGWAVLSLPVESIGLAGLVQAELPNSGVHNPVTAVLLNFRGYDTLLEIGVLLLAVFGVWSLRSTYLLETLPDKTLTAPLQISLVRLLVPLIVVIAGYLIWIGTYAPGGAFQGGAVLGAAWVLLMLSNKHLPPRLRGWPLRTGLVSGFAIFLMVAGVVMLMNGHLLQYPRNWAGALILLVEATLTLSISFILAALFVGQASGEDTVEIDI